MPFKSQEIRHQGGVYYGQNTISKNLILANRWELLNANGFVLGAVSYTHLHGAFEYEGGPED